MARMVPSTPGGRTANRTELAIFNLLQDRLPEGWIVMHHVGIQRHPSKPLAEIDFLVIAEPGVFCLEVKGGRVRCEAGIWKAGTRELKESPFTQVGSAGSALRYEVGELEKFVFGWGCMFPDGRFYARGPEIEPEIVFDATSTDPLDYICKLGEYWSSRYPGKRTLGARDIDNVARAIRPDFELVESLVPTMVGVRRELISATRQQAAAIRASREIPRLVVRGGAGTGKTWIASLEAVRMADEGKEVLLTCFNKGLAEHLKSRIVHSRITISHLDGLISSLINRGKTSSSIPDDASNEDLFNLYRPLAAIEGAEAAGLKGAFDVLIVDEAQDLLTNEKVAVMDCVLGGGLRDGIWRVFWDPIQNLFLSGVDVNLNALSSTGASFETMPLDINCRNTKRVAERVEVLADQAVDEVAFTDGPPALDEEWDGAKSQAKRLKKVLTDWLSGGIAPGEIMILSPRAFEKSVASESMPGLPTRIEDVSRQPLDPGRGTVGFSTIQAFKGLEADAIIIVDVHDMTSDTARTLLYVGATRARTFLAVLRHESTRAEFADRLAKYSMRKRGSAGDQVLEIF